MGRRRSVILGLSRGGESDGPAEDAREMFMKVANLGTNPAQDARDEDLPVGLKVRVYPHAQT